MPRPDAFDEGLESFVNYKERLDAFIIANDIAATKQTATLLSSIGAKVYNTLRSLTAPDLPATKTYDELCHLLSNHFCPRPLEIVERFKFHKRNQNHNETLSEYLAAIKRLSEHCNFGDNLKPSLRDRFVCGINDESIQRRLLQEPDLTLDKAVSVALAMETAQKDAAEIHGESSASVHNIYRKTVHKGQGQRKSHETYPPCRSCGKTNHKRDDCFWRDASCNKCKKKGHIQTVCRSKTRSNEKSKRTAIHEIEEQSESTDDELFTLDIHQIGSSKRVPKIMVQLKIDSINTQMELDTGSAVSVMTESNYKEIFKKSPKMNKTNVCLKTYTKELIRPLGTIQVNVEVNGQSKMLPLLILEKGSNPIFGRDWLLALKLDWHSINQISKSDKDSMVESILTNYKDVFAEGIGEIKNFEANIKVREGANPRFLKARTVPYALKPKVEKELDRLEKEKIISKISQSEWATPIVPVLKKNGDIRICGDYKVTLNQVLEEEHYTLPRVEDMMATLESGEKFSKIDIRQAYLTLPIKQECKTLTTINTHKGLYNFNRLVFGITSSPAIWQRTMDQILHGLKGVQCNQDDMIITGKDDQDHKANLIAVLDRLQKHGLKANLDKCQFFRDEVIFCGIKISKEGLHKTTDKIDAVVNAPIPNDKSQLRSFLGLVNYYHKWLPNIANLAKPLYDLLRDKVKYQWNDRCTIAFSKIKDLVASDQVLIRYDPSLELRLACDASPYGIGAVLSHITKNNEERPISYISRTLNSAEKNYSQLDKEALAIVWSVKKFYNYLCGRHFTLITDHQPLRFIFDPKKGIPAMSAARQQRYAAFLSGFNYTIEYRKSELNANADGLSRLPLPKSAKDEDHAADDLFYTTILESSPVNSATIAKESRHDPIISKVINYINQNQWPSPELIPDNIITFHNKKQELTVQQGCLMWGHRIIPPEKLRDKLLATLHEGHLGIVKMKMIARGYFWWPGLDKAIEEITKACHGCAATQPDPLKSPLHPWQWPEKPWQRIHIDYAGPFLNSMFLVVVDAHSKWTEIIPLASATSLTTINILSDLFARFGLPEQIVSDNGTQFSSNEFRSFTKCNGIKHTFSPPYHPATNGLAERMVKTFKQAMKSSKNDKGTLQTKLARFLLAYRNAPHSTTNESPANLMLGRRLRTHIDLIRPDIASTVTTKQHQQAKSHSQANLRNFQVGDTVLARDYRGHQRWQHGLIHSSIGSHTYEIKTTPGAIWKRHADQIVPTSTNPSISKPTPLLTEETPHPNYSSSESTTQTTKSSQSDRDVNYSTRSPVELRPSSPTQDETQISPTIPADPRSQMVPHPHTNTRYITRSGRVVQKPNKYTI